MASNEIRWSSYLRNVVPDLSGGMIQVHAEVAGGITSEGCRKVYFRARYGFVTMEIREGNDEPLRTFIMPYAYDPEKVVGGAGLLLELSGVALIIDRWMHQYSTCVRDKRQACWALCKEFKLTLALEPVTAGPAEPELATPTLWVSPARRRACALAAQSLDLRVVTFDGPDDSVIVECWEWESNCLKVLPGVTKVEMIGNVRV